MKTFNRFTTIVAVCGATILTLTETPRAIAEEPWVTWTRNPLTIPIRVGVSNVYAETNTTVRVTLADGATTIDGYNCSESTNKAPFTANVKVRREYFLTVTASNLNSLDMQLEFKPNWTVLGRRGKAVKPKEYKLLVDRQLNTAGTISASNPGGRTEYSNTWTIELTERLPANWRLEDGSDNASAAPGDGDYPKLGPGKSQSIDRTAIAWSVGLGRLMDGSAAGRLTVREANLSREIYTPTNIYYTAGSEIVRDEVQLITITTNCPVLRQVKSCQTFVDIVGLTNKTEMRFYFPSQIGTQTNTVGHYTNITGNPFVVWELANPEIATTNKLNIVERRNGLSSTNEIIFDPTSTNSTWSLKYGTGSEQRVETRGVLITTSGGATNRLEVVDIRYAGAANPAYRATEKYTLLPWGFELTEVTIDPDNNPGTANNLVTSITFNTDPNAPYSYRQPDTMVYPDGFWEKRLYEDDPYMPWYSMLKHILHPDRDGPGSPNEAAITNSIVTYHPPGGGDSFFDVQEVETYYKSELNSSPRNWFREDFTTRIAWGGGLDYSFTGADVNEDDTVAVGDSAMIFDDTWGFGYFGRNAYTFDDATTENATYVNGGTYNAGTKTFTISTNDVSVGPDFRESVIHYGLPDYREIEELPTGVDLGMVDDQPLFGGGGYTPYVYPYRCWRESTIYQGGSVVQRERHIFTGMDGTNVLFDLVEKWVYLNDSLGHATNVVRIDGATSVSRTVFSADYRGANTFDGQFPLWQIDESGVRTFFTYDSQKRLVNQTKEGVSAVSGFAAQAAITNLISFDASGRTLTNKNTASNLSLSTTTVYDLNGRVTSQTDTNGLTTTVAYDLGGRKITQTLPTGSTKITENYLDRRLKSVTGTGVVSEYHDWNYTDDRVSPLMWRVVTLHTIQLGSPTSARIRTEGIDWVGRVVRWETPDPFQTNSIISYDWYYDFRRKLSNRHSEMVQDGATTMQWLGFEYDGSPNTVSVPRSGLGLPWDPATDYRLTRTDKSFAKIGSHWFECTTNTIYRTADVTNATMSSITLSRQNGFANGNVLSEETTYDADTNAMVVTSYIDLTTKKITTVEDSAQSTLNATNIVINGLPQLESTATVSSPTRHYYDALGRQTSLVSPLGFTAYTTYNGNGQTTSSTDFTGQTTIYDYYVNGQTGAGQVKSVTAAGKITYSSYTARGESTRRWGDVPYPEERIYSSYGEMVELRTFRNGSGWNGASWPASPGTYDTTTWTYQDWSGLLLGKTDANNKTVSYTYDRKLLQTRTWARGNSVTNLYNDLGELVGMDYSDGTHSVSFVSSDYPDFSRTGKPLMVLDDSGAWRLLYDHADRLVAAVCTNGLLNGITVSNRFNGLYGQDQIQVLGSSPQLTDDYRYDAASGRLSVVSNAVYSATYGYLPNSDLLQTTTFKNNGTTKLTTTRGWEYGTRLSAILNQAGSTMVSSHGYQYDSLNRRTRASLEDGSYWQYDYNDRNELTGAHRYWSDMYPASGQQFAYGYDNIGNRLSAQSGGDINGANLRAISYTANGLNQYTAITTPGFEDIMGVALATNSVTVNSSTADRKVEYFHREITVTNSTSPVWQAVTVTSGGSTSNGGFVFPKNSQTLTYDLDGNLTFDGVWTYEWDAENRLKTMTMTNVSGIANAQRKRLEFAYDYMNRRVQKVVSAWNGSAFTSPVTNQFVYDGWNLLAELDVSHNALRSYMWGLDLSGTMGNAGGVGGLLLVADHVPVTDTYHFVGYDGNGNVTALVNAADQTVSARYEYSAYGELLRSTGPLAMTNPFRWSTKFSDDESGLAYYGYRYFSPTQGRWFGRDPIGEDGGINLYAFLINNSIDGIDKLGQTKSDPWPSDVPAAFKEVIEQVKQASGSRKDLTLKEIRALYKAEMEEKGSMSGILKRGGNKRNSLSEHRSRGGTRGFVSTRLVAAGAAVSAVSMAIAYFGVKNAVADVREMAESGIRPEAGSPDKHIFDFVRNVDSGELAWAELDALSYIIESGSTGADALVMWSSFQDAAAGE